MAGSNSMMSIEKLTGRDNFASWSFAVKAYLQHEDLYDCVLKEPLATDPNSVKQDTKAKSKLILLVNPILFVHIQEAQTAKQVWDRLAKAFEDSGLTRKVGLLKELINTKLENSVSVEDYVNKIMTAAHKLRNIKFHVDDEWLGTLMLAGLPEMYRPMIMGLESSGMKISADLVKNKLLQEVKTSDTTALYTNSKKYQPKDGQLKDKKGPRCFSCNKYGHLSKNCWHKKACHNEKTDKKTGYVAAFSASTANYSYCWHVDSGASMHMTMHRDWLTDLRSSSVSSIKIANNKVLKVECCGNICLKVKAKDGIINSIQVRNVLYVPELKTNLLSVSKIIKGGCRVTFNEYGCQIFNPSNELVAEANLINETYLLNTCKNKEMQGMLAKTDDDAYLWHQRMGHLNFTNLNKIPNCTEGVKLSKGAENTICVTCLEGKQTRKPFPTEGSRATRLLELIHSDVCGPMKNISIGGARYFVTFIDDFSRRVHVYFIKNKNEVFEKFLEFKNRVENELSTKIKILRSDNGTEYKNNIFEAFLKKSGILHQTSTPYTPEQNGLSERMNRTLIERAKCMILNANLHVAFWAEAVATAAYIVNRSPTCALSDVTPYEVWTGKKPNLSHMKIFGCPAMVLIPKEKRTKLDVKSRKLIFVGYSDSTKGYRFIDPETKKGLISRDVVFLEALIQRNTVDNTPENKKVISKNNIEIEENKTYYSKEKEKQFVSLPLCEVEPVEDERRETQDASQNIVMSSDESDQFEDVNEDGNDTTYSPDRTLDFSPESHITLRPLPSRMRNQNDVPSNMSSLICQNSDMSTIINVLNCDPQNHQEALNSEKATEWKRAMDQEYQSLIKNNTWTLVDLPEGKSVIPSRWVYKTKIDGNGSISCYKARLVIKGFKQIKGIDYNEVFAPVVRYTSIRYLIGLAAKYGLKIHQMDAVTAFLQGDIDEEIYMSFPPGYENENKVCKLNKSIYGLKQASRQWNKKLNTALLEIGMKRSNIDPCVYYRILNKTDILFITVYVDDILYFFNNEDTSTMIKEKLKEKFYMKDLGTAKHCIGLRISQEKYDEISIDQSLYIQMILTRFGMNNCKPMWTPTDANVKLKKSENQQEILKNIPYQEIIGCLLYLSQGTRPDITYTVNSLSRYNNQPTNEHWMALKRVMRYLKATMSMKLVYKKNVDEIISGYCDSDWASNIEDRRSCTGYLFLFQGAAISWNSKKQQTIALSTSEAEYMALASSIQEALWLKQLADELQPELKGTPITLYCDNQSAINLSKNAVYHARSKHIDVRYHFIREKIAAKQIVVQYKCTGDMVADILTKGLHRPKHENFTSSMGLILKRPRPGEDVRSMDAYR